MKGFFSLIITAWNFPVFGLNTNIYEVFLGQKNTDQEKLRDTFHAVNEEWLIIGFSQRQIKASAKLALPLKCLDNFNSEIDLWKEQINFIRSLKSSSGLCLCDHGCFHYYNYYANIVSPSLAKLC